MSNKTFEDFNFSLVKFRNHKGEIKEKNIVIDWIKAPKKKLILMGNPGVGKTHLAKAILRQFLTIRRNNSDNTKMFCNEIVGDKLLNLTSYYSAQELYVHFKNLNMSGKLHETAIVEKRLLLRVELFILDDLGSELSTEKEVFPRGFKNLMDEFEEKKMIVTTNLSFEDLEERYKEKIISRLHHEAVIVIIEAEDFRKRGLK